MGNSENNISFPTFTSSQWKTILPPRRNIPGTPSLCLSSDGLVETDCYDITVHSTLEEYINTLINRKTISNPQILKLIDVKLKQRQMFQCNLKERLQIYTQKIICRLGEFSLTKNETLFLLKQTIESFILLASFCKQYFVVTQKMIGFSSEGQVKIWLNQHFGYSDLKQQNLARSEYQMIISIVKCFQNNEIKVQDFYSFSKFEQLMKHLSFRLHGLQVQKIKKIICQKAKKYQIAEYDMNYQSKSSENTPIFELQRQINSDSHRNIQNQFSKVENNLKENINPIKQIKILQEFQRIRTPVYWYEVKTSESLPSHEFSTRKKSIKELTNSINTSSLKSFDSSKKETSLSNSSSFTKKKYVQFSDSTNNSQIDEFSEASPPFRDLREISLRRPKLICQPSHLKPQIDVMSCITQRSHEDDETSYIGTQKKINAMDLEFEEDLKMRCQENYSKPLECCRGENQDNYFTRIDL